MENYFSERKTIRKYSNKEVSDDLLNEILDKSMRAPTTGNMQLYSVIVTRDLDIKSKLLPTHFGQQSVMESSVLLTFCADFNRFEKWCELSNAVPGYDNFQSFCTAFLDASIFTQQFNTIAEMNGLGCCYLGTTTYNAPKISEILNLPKRVIPIATLAVGYPSDEAQNTPQVERLPLEAIIHKEVYNNYSDAKIKELYSEKENLEANKRFVSENNKETLAQVFTDVRYTQPNNEFFSKVFYDYISEQGFKFPE